MPQLPINTFSPSIKLPLFQRTHMVTTTEHLIHVFQVLNQSGLERIVYTARVTESQSAMNIGPHGVNQPINSQQYRMMMAAWYLLDEGFEYDLFGVGVFFVMFVLADSCLTVLVMSEKEYLIHVHLKRRVFKF